MVLKEYTGNENAEINESFGKFRHHHGNLFGKDHFLTPQYTPR
jgi:hypothetical protein